MWERRKARLRDFEASGGSILSNGNAARPSVVTIAASDKGFETSRCGDWTTNLKRITVSETSFGEGTFIVNIDLAPGTYRSAGADGCYWARLKSFAGGIDGIRANGNPTGSAVVTIAASDRGFESNGCGRWSKLSELRDRRITVRARTWDPLH